MKEDSDIEYEEGYDPLNEVHNPSLYVWAKQEAIKDIEKERINALKRRLKDKPGQFAKLGCVYWLLIIGLCMFVGYLFTL